MKNIFKRKKRFTFDTDSLSVIQCSEDPKTKYLEFPDGLRLIFRDGKYVGFYQKDPEREN